MELTHKWAAVSHTNKPISRVITRYFGKFNKARNDPWVFGDRAGGAYLHRFGWTKIVRHQIVRYRASPDDPDLTEYWAWRRRKTPLPVNKTERWLLGNQDGVVTPATGCFTPPPTRHKPRTTGRNG